ncbi:MAG: hypothetical protein BAJALOKI1v1_800006 [Promethearchaeota archaeon]|nr:MAG: hypothetical protein BAJALOKI1v1_800006 [Candidatus Lokiarchaeota archaeon]
MRLRGTKTVESTEQQIRAFFIVRKIPQILDEIQIDRKVRGGFFMDYVGSTEFTTLMNGV